MNSPPIADVIAANKCSCGFPDKTPRHNHNKLIDNIEWYVEVIQTIDIADAVSSADIESLLKGHVRVQQDGREVRNVTGYKGKAIG